jgi:hypothetical protein
MGPSSCFGALPLSCQFSSWWDAPQNHDYIYLFWSFWELFGSAIAAQFWSFWASPRNPSCVAWTCCEFCPLRCLNCAAGSVLPAPTFPAIPHAAVGFEPREWEWFEIFRLIGTFGQAFPSVRFLCGCLIYWGGRIKIWGFFVWWGEGYREWRFFSPFAEGPAGMWSQWVQCGSAWWECPSRGRVLLRREVLWHSVRRSSKVIIVWGSWGRAIIL